jgi:signal transduction histidine kinase
VSRSAYRIVQEGLTNVLKHVGPTHVDVRLACGQTAVEVEVRNAGGAPAKGSMADGAAGRVGHGIIGIRERVALFGGDVDIGPVGDGFRIWVRLPHTKREERDASSPAG